MTNLTNSISDDLKTELETRALREAKAVAERLAAKWSPEYSIDGDGSGDTVFSVKINEKVLSFPITGDDTKKYPIDDIIYQIAADTADLYIAQLRAEISDRIYAIITNIKRRNEVNKW